MKSPLGGRVKAVKKCFDCLQKLNVLRRGNGFWKITAHLDRHEGQAPTNGDTSEVQVTGPGLQSNFPPSPRLRLATSALWDSVFSPVRQE